MTGYIAKMRKLVGHQTIMQCAASIICVDEHGRILLGQRSDNHMLGYAGGAVEVDEYVEDCARRELYEEMGIIAKELELFDINSGPEAHYVYPNQDEVSNVEIVYLCKTWEGEPRSNDGEMSNVRFYDPTEFTLDQISPPTRKVVGKFLRQSGYEITDKGENK